MFRAVHVLLMLALSITLSGCVEAVVCGPGRYLIPHSGDDIGECVSCTGHTYQPLGAHNATECMPQSRCSKGYHIDPSTLSFTQQASCVPCPADTYQDQDNSSYTECQMKPTCFPGQYLSTASPQERGTCLNCDADTYQPDRLSRALNCTPQATCPPGTRIVNFTPIQRAHCVSCESGTFRSDIDHQFQQCNLASVCDSSSYMSVSASHTSDTQCESLTECTSSQYEAEAATIFSNRRCENCYLSCPVGTFQLSPCTRSANTVCEQCSICQFGYYRTSGCEGTANSVCARCPIGMNCTDCESGVAYISRAASADQARVCSPLTICSEDEFEARPPPRSLGYDRICTLTTHCDAASEYETVSPTTTTDRLCVTATMCEPGTYVGTHITPTTDRACGGTCDGVDFYSDTYNAPQCNFVQRCSAGSYSQVLPTPSSDRICTPCPNGSFQPIDNTTSSTCILADICDSDEYLAVEYTPTSNAICLPISPCIDGITFEAYPPTPTSDRMCTLCRPVVSCGVLEFEVACSPTMDLHCAQCRVCNSTEFIDLACEGTFNTMCASCDLNPCPSGTFQSRGCDGGPATERECTPWSQCDDSEYEVQAPSHTSNRICAAVTTCELDEYIAEAPSFTSDRGCLACTTCSQGAFRLPGCNGTTTQPGACTECTICADDEYIHTPCGSDTDTVCHPFTDICYISQPATATSDATCTNLSDCEPGYGTEVHPTLSTDRTCVPCRVGQTSDVVPNMCTDPTPCAAGSFVVRDPTVIRDRGCSSCISPSWTNKSNAASCDLTHTYCSVGEYEQVQPTSSSDRNCQPWTDCLAGTYVSNFGEVSNTTNRICAPCDGVLRYSETPNQANCNHGTICIPGEFESAQITSSSDRVCSRCPPNSFQPNPSALSCFNTRICNATQFEVNPPTLTSDRVCGPVTVCGSMQIELAPATATSDAICSAFCNNLNDCLLCELTWGHACEQCTACDFDHYQTSPCNRTANRICTPCSLDNCGLGQFRSADCSDTADRVCSPIQDLCDTNQFEAQVPTLTTDRLCLDVDDCSDTEFELLPPSSTSNRICLSAAQPCDVDGPAQAEFESAELTATTDRVCSPVYTCNSSEYEIMAPTSSTDRVCSALTPCRIGEEVGVAHTATSDRSCLQCGLNTYQPLPGQLMCRQSTNCLHHEFESTPVTTSSDRTCRNRTICESEYFDAGIFTSTTDRVCVPARLSCGISEYISQLATPTSDSICSPLTTGCDIGQGEASAPTRTSDRLCGPCPRNTYQDLQGFLQCRPATRCSFGEYETVAHTTSTDRQCDLLRTCNLTIEYYSQHDYNTDRTCITMSRCEPGFGQTTPPTATSDRICSPCNGVTEYQNTTSTYSGCKSVLNSCPLNMYGAVAPTTTSDRICLPATACLSNEFESAEPTISSDRQCQNITTCPIGSAEIDEPTATSDRICRQCNGYSEYQDSLTATSCLPTKQCVSNQTFEFIAPTSSTDRICENLTVCDIGWIESTIPTATSDRSCSACDGIIEYQDEEGADSCRNVSTCNPGFYESASSTMTSDTMCTIVSDCDPGSFIRANQTVTSDRDCDVCDGLTEFQSLANQESCETALACNFVSGSNILLEDAGEFESIPLTSSSDRVCSFVQGCDTGSKLIQPHTTTSDRICRNDDASIEVALSSPNIIYSTDVAAQLGIVPSAAYISVMLIVNGTSFDLSTDEQVLVIVNETENLVMVQEDSNGRFFLVAAQPDMAYTTSVRIALAQYFLTTEITVSVLTSSPSSFILNSEQIGDSYVLRRFEGTSPGRYQHLSLIPEIQLSNGTFASVVHAPGVVVSVQPSFMGTALFDAEGVWTITPSRSGIMNIAIQYGAGGPSPVNSIEVVDSPVLSVSRILNLTSYDISGVLGAVAGNISFSVEFENGQVIIWSDTVLPSLANFLPSIPNVVSVLPNGSVVPQSNAGSVTIIVSAGSESAETSFAVDLLPLAGEIDIGNDTPYPLRTMPAAGIHFSIPIYLNCGSDSIIVFEIAIDWDPLYLYFRGIEASVGQVSSRLSETGNSLLVVGAISGGLSGSRARLLELQLSGQSLGASRIRVTVLNILNANGGLVGQAGPRTSPSANAIQLIGPASIFSSAGSLNSPITVTRNPNAIDCFDDTMTMFGDVNGDCIISLLDLLHIQLALDNVDPDQGNFSANIFDVDGNGALDTDDVSILLRSLLGLNNIPRVSISSGCEVNMTIELFDHRIEPPACSDCARVYVGLYSTQHSFQAFFDSAEWEGAAPILRGPQDAQWPYYGGLLMVSKGSRTLPITWLDAPNLRNVGIFIYQEGGTTREPSGQWFLGSINAPLSDRFMGNFTFLTYDSGTIASFANRAPYLVLMHDQDCPTFTIRDDEARSSTKGPIATPNADDSAVSPDSEKSLSTEQLLIVVAVATLALVILVIIIMRYSYDARKKADPENPSIALNQFNDSFLPLDTRNDITVTESKYLPVSELGTIPIGPKMGTYRATGMERTIPISMYSNEEISMEDTHL